jgi:hypothetical protein
MDILSFNKITKPIYEGGATISLKPESEWFFEVRRTDGTIRYPFGDKWIKNVVLDQFKNQVLNNGGFGFQNQGTGFRYDFLNCFFGVFWLYSFIADLTCWSQCHFAA